MNQIRIKKKIVLGKIELYMKRKYCNYSFQIYFRAILSQVLDDPDKTLEKYYKNYTGICPFIA